MKRLLDLLRHRARLRCGPPDHAAGRRGEDLAHRHLSDKGLTIVARNWRARSGGEIDIVALDRETLVFVEVKSRASEEHGTPEAAVGPDKRDSLVRSAREYARRAGVSWDRVRFDIVSVLHGTRPALTHYRDVFGTGFETGARR